MPDVNRIGELNDHVELGRLLQLVLGCAVNCDHKEGRFFLPLGGGGVR